MSAVVLIEISVRVEKDAPPGSHGIARDATTVVDVCQFVTTADLCDAYAAAWDQLSKAARKCEQLSEEVAWS